MIPYTRIILVVLLMSWMTPSLASSVQEGETDAELAQAIRDLGAKSRSTIIQAIRRLGELGDPAALPALEALQDRRLRTTQEGRILILAKDGKTAQDALSGETLNTSGLELETPIINNAVRRILVPVMAQLRLGSPHPQIRLAAAREINKRPDPAAADTLRKVLETESDAQVRELLVLALAKIDLGSGNREQRLQAIAALSDSGGMQAKASLLNLLEQRPDGGFTEPDPEVRAAAEKALAFIERNQFYLTQVGNLLYGLSLGSVLLLAALGLAITFGLMGVINMAHGEMLMLGAYSTFVVQNLFRSYLPGHFEWYLMAAVPVAFLVSAMIGIVLERTIIRYLYGRPLETLLATWGISLMLIQTVRQIFGAQNVEVANPHWLSGGYTLAQGLVLPYNRIVIVLFTVFVVALVWVLLQRTRLGLQVRAVTQNRPIAACMGIPTARVDMWTFGLGSGVAGLGGVALSQLGNVGPELGQAYIVDCFMVVVLGGVGKIAGAVAGALSLGMINKFLEPMTGAVLGKILVLVFIILFIQKRPQGMFALRGRAAEG